MKFLYQETVAPQNRSDIENYGELYLNHQHQKKVSKIEIFWMKPRRKQTNELIIKKFSGEKENIYPNIHIRDYQPHVSGIHDQMFC